MSRPRLPLGTSGTIAVTKLETGGYQAEVRVRDLDGMVRKVRRRGPTPAKAMAALRSAVRDRTAPVDGELTERSTLSELVDLWFADREKRDDIRPGTLRVYRAAWRTAATGTLRSDPKNQKNHDRGIGGHTLAEATPRTLTLGLRFMEKVPTQMRQVHIILRGALGYAVRMGAIPTNPARELSPPRRSRVEPRALTPVELRLLIEIVRNHRQLINEATGKRWSGPRPTSLLPDVIELLAGSGLRIGEAMALRHEDAQLGGDKPTISVTGTIVEAGGVRRQDLPKTDAAYRTLAIPASVADILRRRKREAQNGCTAFFATKTGGWVTPNNVRRNLRAALTGTELEWVTPHTLRKTVATQIRNARGAGAAAEQLGHTSVATTEAHYLARTRIHDNTDVLEWFDE